VNGSYLLSRQSDILFIGRQETLNDDFETLKRVLNLPEAARLPDDDVASHRNPVNVDKQLEGEATRNLNAWYQRDYEFLELCAGIASRIRLQNVRHTHYQL
jgi:hypothetical protein